VAGAATIGGYDNSRGYTLLATAKVALQGPTGQLQTGFETLVKVYIMPTVITDQPSIPIAIDLNISEGLPLADPDFRQPGPIDLTLGVEVFLVELINLWHKAQGLVM